MADVEMKSASDVKEEEKKEEEETKVEEPNDHYYGKFYTLCFSNHYFY